MKSVRVSSFYLTAVTAYLNPLPQSDIFMRGQKCTKLNSHLDVQYPAFKKAKA